MKYNFKVFRQRKLTLLCLDSDLFSFKFYLTKQLKSWFVAFTKITKGILDNKRNVKNANLFPKLFVKISF